MALFQRFLKGARPVFGGEDERMRLGSLTRRLGLAVVAIFVVAACGSSGGGGGTASCTTAKTAKSASDCGGMDALVAAAKEFRVLVEDWAKEQAAAKKGDDKAVKAKEADDKLAALRAKLAAARKDGEKPVKLDS